MLTVAVLRSWEPEQLPRASDHLQETGVLLDRMAREVGAAAGEMTWRSLIGYDRQMGALRDQAGRLGLVSHIDREAGCSEHDTFCGSHGRDVGSGRA